MKIYLNNKFLFLNNKETELFNSGLLSGYGVFETMRSYKGNIVYLDAHLERLIKSAKLLGLNFNYSKKYLESVVKKSVNIEKFNDSYVKLLAFLGQDKTNIAIIVKRYNPFPEKKYNRGFKIRVSPYQWTPDPQLGRIKTLSRVGLELAYNRARKQGLDEAILLNNKGSIVEGTRTNIFLVKNKKIITPSLECGCLAGITRKVVFDLAKINGIKIIEEKINLKDLLAADEAFLTNSLLGIMPARDYKRKSRGPVTDFLIQEYKNILEKEKSCLKK